MVQADRSKRSFFKKVAAAAGFLATADFLGRLIVARTDLTDEINSRSAHDVDLQKQVLLQKRLVPMTENETKQMLDEILEINGKYHA